MVGGDEGEVNLEAHGQVTEARWARDVCVWCGGRGRGGHLGGVEEERELVPEAGEGAGLRQAQQQAQRVEHAHAA